jgi:hypothetical protein
VVRHFSFELFALLNLGFKLLVVVQSQVDIAQQLGGEHLSEDLLDFSHLGAWDSLLFAILLVDRPESLPSLQDQSLVNRVTFFIVLFVVLSLELLE